MGFWSGSPEKHERVSSLMPYQENILKQGIGAFNKPGQVGGFGDIADYYRSLMSGDPKMLEQFYAPEMRNYKENIIPDLAEQFAGMGSGGLSSSGFRNAGVQAGASLQERLGAIRAQLAMQGAQSMQNLGQGFLGNYSQDVTTQQGSPGFMSYAAPIAGAAIGTMMGGPMGGMAGYQGGQMLSNAFGSKSPYGGGGSMTLNRSMPARQM